MDQKVCLTNQDVVDFCERLKGCEDTLTSVDTTTKEIKTKLDKYDERIDSLEKWRAWITGAMAVVIFILGIIGKNLWDMYREYPQMIKDAVKDQLSVYNIVYETDTTADAEK